MRKNLVCIFAACLIAVSAAMPAYAAETAGSATGTGFVNSIDTKDKPDPKDPIVKKKNGDPIVLEDHGLRLVVTSISEALAGVAPCIEIADDLLAARDEISSSKKPDVTFSTAEDEAAFNDAKEKAEKAGKTIVCCDLFDVSIVDEDNNKVALDSIADPKTVEDAEGQTIDNVITLTLAVNDANSVELVMHREDGKWKVVDYVNNGDGTLTFTLDTLCPIAFFTTVQKFVPIPEPGGNPPGPGITVIDKPTTPHPKPGNPGTSYEPPSPVPAKTTDGGSTNTSTTNVTDTTITPVSNTTESPNTGAGTGSVLLVSAILTTLAGTVLVIKAKKE